MTEAMTHDPMTECSIKTIYCHTSVATDWQSPPYDSTVIIWSQSLDEQDFGEKKEINKRKKLILEGKVSAFGVLSFL